MGFFESYGLFLLQFGTVAAILAFAVARALSRGGEDDGEGRLVIRRLDHQLRDLGRDLRDASMPRKARRAAHKADKKADKTDAAPDRSEADDASLRRIFVLDFEGDVAARQVSALAMEVNAILAEAKPGDEVLLRLSSPGGAVAGYGLGAAQLERLRAAELPLTVAVDKVAASGGYMMAAVAETLLVAPFAMVGSIGVVGTVPNFRRLLERGGVEVEQHTAGRFKRTLTMVGENDEAGREKFKEELAAIHDHFGRHLQRWRPALVLDRVATGEVWIGEQALELGLVDAIGTSDAWLLERRERPILALRWKASQGLGRRLSTGLQSMVERVVATLVG
ncbi:MAG: protease SohB [Deltaproteobacteria bacterium]|nr:protease SohB [Deltaproteobacteria bacterium]